MGRGFKRKEKARKMVFLSDVEKSERDAETVSKPRFRRGGKHVAHACPKRGAGAE